MKRVYNNIKNHEAVTIYYTGTFLIDFAKSLIFAIYTIFLINSGLNLFQASLINFVYMISVVLFEIPTGAFADSLGRKKSMIISTIFLAIGLALYPTYQNFWVFVLAEVLIAISSSFASGAFDAWMVDQSQSQGFTGKVDFVFSQANFISKIALVFGGLIGAYLSINYIGLPFYFGAFIALLVLVFFIIFVDDNQVVKKLSIRNSFLEMKNITKDSIKYCISHKVVIWLVIGAILGTFVFQPMNMYWNVHFNSMAGDKIWLMGWLWAFISIFMALGSYLVKEFVKKGRDYTYIMVFVSIFICVPIIISSLSNVLFVAFPIFLIYEIARGIEKPVRIAYINKFAESEKRATIFSFQAMMSSLGAAGGLIIFGLIAKNTSIQVSWVTAATMALLLIPIYLKARKQESC